MNELSVTTYRGLYNLLCITLLVDGEPIQVHLGNTDEEGLPYYLALDGLPLCDDNGNEPSEAVTEGVLKQAVGRLVSVCSCGEPGCGHTRCHISGRGETVVFNHFMGERGHRRPATELVFTLENYRETEAKVRQIACAEQVASKTSRERNDG